jgi:ElaB/YqjD/DUF883 family membrane-anchored ribosome-binding protein
MTATTATTRDTTTFEPGPHPAAERWMRSLHATPAYRHLHDRARRAGDAASTAVHERLHDAARAVRRTRYAAEDLADETAIRLRRRPYRTAGVAFAVGAAIGALVSALASRTICGEDETR